MRFYFTKESYMNIDTNNKEITKITNRQELADYIRESVNGEKYTDEEKAEKEAKIFRKLKMGSKLSSEEMRFLQQTNSALYAQAMRVRMLAKGIEEQVKHAKSKEEANNIISTAMSNVSKEDPAKESIIAAYERISKGMHKSPGYSRLPNTDSDAKKARDKKDELKFKDAEDEDSNEFDSDNWSPLQEVIDAMPKFEVGA